MVNIEQWNSSGDTVGFIGRPECSICCGSSTASILALSQPAHCFSSHVWGLVKVLPPPRAHKSPRVNTICMLKGFHFTSLGKDGPIGCVEVKPFPCYHEGSVRLGTGGPNILYSQKYTLQPRDPCCSISCSSSTAGSQRSAIDMTSYPYTSSTPRAQSCYIPTEAAECRWCNRYLCHYHRRRIPLLGITSPSALSRECSCTLYCETEISVSWTLLASTTVTSKIVPAISCVIWVMCQKAEAMWGHP